MDKELVRELVLFSINNGNVYRKITVHVIENLQKKYRKGVFDSEKSVKAFEKVVESNIKEYAEMFCSPGFRVSKADREAIQKELSDYYYEQITESEV